MCPNWCIRVCVAVCEWVIQVAKGICLSLPLGVLLALLRAVVEGAVRMECRYPAARLMAFLVVRFLLQSDTLASHKTANGPPTEHPHILLSTPSVTSNSRHTRLARLQILASHVGPTGIGLPPHADDQHRQLHLAAARHGDAGRPGLRAEDAALRLRRTRQPL